MLIRVCPACPGELRGIFKAEETTGYLTANTETGVYGMLSGCPASAQEIPVALKQQVTEGNAYILSTIEGDCPKPYAITIEKVNLNNSNPTKNMVIRITDKQLLNKTGGIVQGMSGSPIIQNGRFVGAVTHVFVNDPTRGYAIFGENMLKTAQNLSPDALKKAS